MYLDQTVLTFGRAMREKYGFKVHKLAIDAQFTCPNRDGSKGIGGCTFCNNTSFSPNARKPSTEKAICNALSGGGLTVIALLMGAVFNHSLAASTSTMFSSRKQLSRNFP